MTACSPWLVERIGHEIEVVLATGMTILGELAAVEPGGLVLVSGSLAWESYVPLSAVIEVRRPICRGFETAAVYARGEGSRRRRGTAGSGCSICGKGA